MKLDCSSSDASSALLQAMAAMAFVAAISKPLFCQAFVPAVSFRPHTSTSHTNRSFMSKKESSSLFDEDLTRISNSEDTVNGATSKASDPVSKKQSSKLVTGWDDDSTSVRRRKMELSWCGRNDCTGGNGIREKVVGEHNHVEFEGPATGQVMYEWAPATDARGEMEEEKTVTAPPSVLLIVKRGDDELLKVAADAVQNLTALSIDVLLHPELSAKIKHYFGVDGRNIKLFEPKLVPGYGGSHLKPRGTTKAKLQSDLQKHQGQFSSSENADAGPDLVCSLGGDGLLMYASTLFQGPVPPVLCIAGGSMGFLTPFSKEEMVDAIATALGMIHREEEESIIDEGTGYFPGGGTAPVAVRPLMSPSYTDDGGDVWSGPASHPDYYDENYLKPKYRFGAYNRICLSMRMRLDCRIINPEGVVRARFSVLNEVVIDRGSSPYLANLECFCDDVHLTTVQADGIIFATPTGSTAYSMAAGGSVVHPAVPAILVTPICPHVLSFRSMVFPDHVVLRCYVPDDARSDACVAFDGKARRELHRGDSVQIQMSAHPVPTINRVDHSSDWLNSLKRNFNFNSRVRQSPL